MLCRQLKAVLYYYKDSVTFASVTVNTKRASHVQKEPNVLNGIKDSWYCSEEPTVKYMYLLETGNKV